MVDVDFPDDHVCFSYSDLAEQHSHFARNGYQAQSLVKKSAFLILPDPDHVRGAYAGEIARLMRRVSKYLGLKTASRCRGQDRTVVADSWCRSCRGVSWTFS